MEAAIFGALLSSTLPMILKVIEQSYSHLKGLATDVGDIQAELEFLQVTIKEYRRSCKDICSLRRVWIAELRRLGDDIQDCMDCFPSGKTNATQFREEITELKRRAKHAHERLKLYTSSMEPSGGASSSTAGGGAQGEEAPPGADDLVGVGIMDGPFNELKNLVLEPGRKVISIVGFGGIGKTLLAHRVYHDVRTQFPVHALVRAADRDAKEILSKILNQVHSNAPITSDVAELNGLLTSHLAGNKYLIIIDDVRTTSQWDAIKSAFPQADEVDSRIMVTTTIQSVAQHCSSRSCHVYRMKTLGNEELTELFFRTINPVGSPSPAMKQESAAILKKCDGLPLALVSTADFLRVNGRRAGVRACEQICRRLHDWRGDGSDDHTLARMHQVLARSYGSLSSIVLQDCLLYFCMFPLEDLVGTNSLIRRWLAEGIVPNPHDAVENLRILADRNIIQPIQVSNNDIVKRCRSHGMMLDYISRKSMSENFITLLSSETTVLQPENVRRLSLHPANCRLNVLGDLLSRLSRLHTLAVFPTATSSNYEAHLKFATYKLLRVLDLKECSDLGEDHLEAICDLLLLKYLSFGGTISRVPRNIKKLKSLETLDLSRSEIVTTVYKEVIMLPKLKHLLGKFQLSRSDTFPLSRWLKSDPKKFLKDKSVLETLSGFVAGERKGFPELMRHMIGLRKVKIWCKPNASQANLNHLKEGIKVFISQDNQTTNVDYSLSIDFQDCKPFLESLQAPGSLASLKLHGRLTQFPRFVTQLTGIKELCLSGTSLSGADILAGLSNFNVLKYLKLIEGNLSPLDIGTRQLSSLERILVGTETTPDITIQAGALRYLVSLHISCKALRDVLPGIQIRNLPNLKEITLHTGVAQGTKDAWKEAARCHPNRPSISFTQGP